MIHRWFAEGSSYKLTQSRHIPITSVVLRLVETEEVSDTLPTRFLSKSDWTDVIRPRQL